MITLIVIIAAIVLLLIIVNTGLACSYNEITERIESPIIDIYYRYLNKELSLTKATWYHLYFTNWDTDEEIDLYLDSYKDESQVKYRISHRIIGEFFDKKSYVYYCQNTPFENEVVAKLKELLKK